jgi:hypothetical protein
MRKYLIPTLFLFLISCSPLRPYRKVVNDKFRNSAERELLARAAQQEFPAIIGDTPQVTVVWDSTEYNELAKAYDELADELIRKAEESSQFANRDTIIEYITRTLKPATITKTVTKEVKIRDAVWAEVKENEIRQARWENERLRIETGEAKTRAKNRMTIIYFLGGALTFLLLIVVWKPKLPTL